jgi:hypothetical protein
MAVVPKHTITAVAACVLFMKTTNNAIVSEKCYLLTPYSEVSLSHVVPCRVSVKTLFKLSFNSTPTPLAFNFQSQHSFTMMKRSHSKREN